MTDSHWHRTGRPDLPSLAGPAVAQWLGLAIAVVIVACLAVPRGTMTFLGLLGLLAIARYAVLSPDWGRLARPDPTATPVLLVGVLAIASALWSAAPQQSLESGAVLSANILLVWLLLQWFASESREAHDGLRRGILFGALVGLGLLLIEIVSDQALRRFVFNAVPALRPEHMHYVDVKGDTITRIRFHQLNRHIAVLVLIFWPVLLVAVRHAPARIRLWLTAGLGVATTAAALLSWHESSKLALIASFAAFGLAWINVGLALRTIAAGFVVAAVAILPVSIAAFEHRLYEASWIQESGRARLILWGVTAERVLDAPILGIGAGAGRVLDDAVKDTAPTLPGQPYALRTGPHQHNVYLQTWYELGALGVVLLTGAGLAVLRRLSLVEARWRPYGFAAFTAAVTMAATSYGLWQAWLLATYGLAAIILAAGLAETGRGDEG